MGSSFNVIHADYNAISNSPLEMSLRTPTIAALVLSLAAIPCVATSAEKAPAARSAAQGAGAEQSRPFASVNGVAIPQVEARIILEDRRAAGATDSPALQNAVRNQLLGRELFAQQARKLGLDKDPAVLARIRMGNEEILARAYQQDYLTKHSPTEDQVRKEYDSTKLRSGDKEFHLRQVVMASEDEAKGIITRLRGGESLQSLAKQSLDEISRNRDGDLGWIAVGNLLPQFAEAAQKLAKGQHTPQPVKSSAGWHVLLLEEQRPFTMPPYDAKIQAQIRQALARQVLAAHLAELTKAAKIE
jgi:peptidyl-prolyl cis-trans isomerase C